MRHPPEDGRRKVANYCNGINSTVFLQDGLGKGAFYHIIYF